MKKRSKKSWLFAPVSTELEALVWDYFYVELLLKRMGEEWVLNWPNLDCWFAFNCRGKQAKPW